MQQQLFEHNKLLKKIIIYTGIKTSNHPLFCYWTNAFVQYNNNLQKCSINPFGNAGKI